MAKTKIAPPKRMTAKQRLDDLKSVVNMCFDAMPESDYKEIANLTGLCVSTIYRMDTNQITLASHFGTIQRLALAAGFGLSMTDLGIEVRIIEQ